MVRNKKSFILLSIGGLIFVAAILNLFIDIPDMIASYQLEQSLNTKRVLSNQDLRDDVSGYVITTMDPTLKAPDGVMAPEKQVIVTPIPTDEASIPVEVIEGYVPDRIIIPAIGLDAPITQSTFATIELREVWFEQWNVPDEFAAGWLTNTAPLGTVGNTVISGHHNEYGKVFANLYKMEAGDIIYVFSGGVTFTYKVVDRQLLKEKDVSLDIRKANAAWISPSVDERLTLVTCWPKRSNTHRLIIVAEPYNEAQTG